MRTEYPFTLPRGYVDASGNVHREGTMRLATARDEIEPLARRRSGRTRRTCRCSFSPASSPASATSRRDARGGREPLRGRLRPPPAPLRAAQHRRRGGRLGHVPVVLASVRGRPHRHRGQAPGGMTRPSPHELLAEAAELAYHFHWSLDTILDLEHPDRRRFLEEADAISRPGPAGKVLSQGHGRSRLLGQRVLARVTRAGRGPAGCALRGPSLPPARPIGSSRPRPGSPAAARSRGRSRRRPEATSRARPG